MPTIPLAATAVVLLASCASSVSLVSPIDLIQEGVEQAPALELPRHPALSPDGSRIAFSHQGDVWVAQVDTGIATRLTAHDSMDAVPYWSPNGKELAFLSNRHGNYDVYLMPAWGGVPQRITWDSSSSQLHGWLNADQLLIGTAGDRRYLRGEVGAWVGHRDGRTPTLLGDWGMMNPVVSADGQWLVYERGHSDPKRRAYRGAASSALWVCNLQTGEHEELTSFDGSDISPMLSADGGTVYFLSDRVCAGNESGRDLGLWKISSSGGTPEMVYHPGGQSLRTAGISGDGSRIVAELGLGLVMIDTASGAPSELMVRGSYDPSEPPEYERTVSGGASELAISPDGDSIAFEAGGDIYVLRKHDDINRCERVTSASAPDYNPVWTEDGEALLFISERDGNGEVYRTRLSDDSETFYRAPSGFQSERLTHTLEDESALSLSPDGETAVWVVGAGRLVVGNPTDMEAARVLYEGFAGPDYDWSPDSKWLAYSALDDDFNSEVYVQRVDVEGLSSDVTGVEAVNLTQHPDDDTGPRWSPDGRKLSFTSRRMMLDETDVWVLWLRAEDLERTEQERLEYEEDQKNASKAEPEPEPAVAGAAAAEVTDDNPVSGSWKGSMSTPEGSVSFSLTLSLRVDGTVTGTVVTPGFSGAVTGTWDSERNHLEVAYAPEGSDAITIAATISGDEMSGGAELATGNAPFLARLQSPEDAAEAASQIAKDEEEEEEEDEDGDEEEEEAIDEVVIDFEDVHSRMRRVTNREGNEDALDWGPDSEKVYFNTSFGTRLTNGTTGETGLFTVDVRELEVEKVHSSTASSFTRSGKGVYYVRGGKIVGGDGKAKDYGFSVSFREQRRALRDAVMQQAWRILDRNFYDANFHNHDWAASLDKWLPLALAASTQEDYTAIVNWMLGEMNASHMGYYNFGGAGTQAAEIDNHSTGRLGVLWDESYQGAGRKVAEVLPRTPAARSISRLEVGDVVLAVNGEAYQDGENWARLMLGTVGEETRLRVADANSEEREVVIRPSGSLRAALYERDIRAARTHVDEKSAGRLGYVHIEGMSTPSLLEFERELYAAGKGKEVLLIDVRENGGGWTTDMLLTMLMVRDHAITIPRGGGQGYPQGRRVFATWDKPIVVLCNENSYSNAEIFSWAIKTLERGPIVGKQTYGAVISTGGAGLLDGSFVRLPFRGWYVADEAMTNMELNGCPPDYPVENLPGDFAEGVDRQLDKAIEIGLSL